jgi:hypothetical protein
VLNYGLEKLVNPAPRRTLGSYILHFLCRDHFLPTDFMTPEGIHLKRVAVPFGLDSAPRSNPQPSLPAAFNPLPSEASPKRNNLDILLPHRLPSELTPGKKNVYVLLPLRTYSKLSLSLICTETPPSINIHFI